MNKESIYKIIGYDGEYNASVKKAIRKLLKENHPDNKGDRQVFELINEVKKELESNKVSYNNYHKKEKRHSTEDGIDYEYCRERYSSLTKKKDEYLKELNKKEKELAQCEKEYRDLYRSNIDTESSLLLSSLNKKKLNSTKVLAIIFLVVSVFLFIAAVIKSSIMLFTIFVFVAMICILIIQKYLMNTHNLMQFSSKKLKEYVKSNSVIRKNIETQNEIKREMLDINKKVSNIDNDLRFYDNLLK